HRSKSVTGPTASDFRHAAADPTGRVVAGRSARVRRGEDSAATRFRADADPAEQSCAGRTLSKSVQPQPARGAAAGSLPGRSAVTVYGSESDRPDRRLLLAAGRAPASGLDGNAGHG